MLRRSWIWILALSLLVFGLGGVYAAGPGEVASAIASLFSWDTSRRVLSNTAGAGANGAAVVGNPVLVAGSDGTNTRTLATDSTGALLPAAQRATYRCTVTVAAAAGVAVELQASATKTIRVTGWTVVQPTVAGTVTVSKRSALCAGGVPVAQTEYPFKTSDPVATGVVVGFTGAPAAGALVGDVFSVTMQTSDIIAESYDNYEERARSPTLTAASTEAFTVSVGVGATVTVVLTWTEE